jgi:dextranase
MRGYYDFVVRYENTLSDLHLVTLSAEEVQKSIQLNGVAVSATGEAGTTWAIMRQMPQFTTVNLINLNTATDAAWNEPKPLPQTLRDLPVEIRVEDKVVGAFAASPEHDEGRPYQLAYSLVQREGVTWLQTTLPALEYWSMITIKTVSNDPA